MSIVPVLDTDTPNVGRVKWNESIADLDARDALTAVGVPVGGATDQVLAKATAADGDTYWKFEAAVIAEAVAGGAGFQNVQGDVTLNLALGRNFLQRLIGNVGTLAFSNVPDGNAFSAGWLWVLEVDSLGPYVISVPPTVTWLNGGGWSDLDLTANARNFVWFFRVAGVTYARLLSNGETELEPLVVSFPTNGTAIYSTGSESIDIPAATKPRGNGTITYQRSVGNGTPAAITARTTFAVGDNLHVICASATTHTSVRVPRYAL